MNKNYKQSNTRSSLRIFGGSSHPTLTKSIARKVGVTVGDLTLAKFANNETSIDLKENVRGQVKKKKMSKKIIWVIKCQSFHSSAVSTGYFHG